MASAKLTSEAHAEYISKALNESESWSRNLIKTIIIETSIEFADKLLEETLQIQDNGGMLVNDGSRKRTPGGVFFQLARQHMDEAVVERLFVTNRRPKPSNFKHFKWEKRARLIQRSLQESGKVHEMQITLLRKPLDWIRSQDTVILQLQQYHTEIVTPVGLPPLPENDTIFTVYLSIRHWRKVENDLKAKDHWLHVEGKAF